MRKPLAFLAGVVAGALTLGTLEWAAHLLMPAGPVDALSRPPFAPMPTVELLSTVVAWAAGAFVGGWVATRVGRTTRHGLAVSVGSFLMGGGLMHVVALASPAWFKVLGLAVFLPFALAGWWAGRRLT